MTSGYQAVLDACVLVNAALRDTLLRVAEPPRLYLPRWSAAIMDELTRTLEAKIGLSAAQTARLVGQLRAHFGDCWVEGYEPLIPAMGNHSKDRHVPRGRCAYRRSNDLDLQFARLSAEALALWNVEAQSPDAFLVHQFHINPAVVLGKLQEQAGERGGMERLLTVHTKTVPTFIKLVREALTS